MFEHIPVVAASSTVNIVEYRECLWAACKACRDKGVNDFELVKKYIDWFCPNCEVRVNGAAPDWIGSQIELIRPNADLCEWVAEWLNVPMDAVQVSISV